jgi:hypothetical protein
MKRASRQNRSSRYRAVVLLASASVLGACAAYGPYHGNTASEPFKSVRGPADGRYKMAFIEFGGQGSPLDNTQRKAALEVIHKAERPLLFVYIHGWQNNAASADVCRFEHFLDMVSSFPEFTGRKITVIGVYIAWRGKDLTVPGLSFLTFRSRKSAGGEIAAANSCLASIEELAVAAREPGKEYHHTVLMGHSFGALVLGNTISHSILGANGEGGRSSSPWDMAVTFNSADNSITTRQLMSEFDYLYKYDPQRRAYVSRGNLGEEAAAVSENRPALVYLQSENDSATGQIFPIGQGLINVTSLHFHWQKVKVPGHTGEKISESEFYTHTPGNNKYLVNYQVVSLGETSAPSGLRATENRAFEANIRDNRPDFTFYTSEHNDGHEANFCHDGQYSPGKIHPPTGKELWRKWKFEYTGNARIPCWVVRVPKDIIWGHGGLWSDNSVAMFGALFRMEFPLSNEGKVTTPKPVKAPRAPDPQQLYRDGHSTE